MIDDYADSNLKGDIINIYLLLIISFIIKIILFFNYIKLKLNVIKYNNY